MTVDAPEHGKMSIDERLERIASQVDYLTRRAEASEQRWELIEDLGKDLALVGHSAFAGALDEMRDLDPSASMEDSLRLLRRLFESAKNIEWAVEQLESWRDFAKDAGPIIADVVQAVTDILDRLDKSGVLKRGGRMAGIAETAVAACSEEDLRDLQDNVAQIIQTAKALTQPGLLASCKRLASAYEEAASQPLKPSLWGLLQELRHPETRRGLAVLVKVLRAVGEGTTAVSPSGQRPLLQSG